MILSVKQFLFWYSNKHHALKQWTVLLVFLFIRSHKSVFFLDYLLKMFKYWHSLLTSLQWTGLLHQWHHSFRYRMGKSDYCKYIYRFFSLRGNPALNDHSLQSNPVKPHNIIVGCEPIIHYNTIYWLGLFNAHERLYLLCNISLASIEQRSKSLLIDYYSGLYYAIYWGLSSSIMTISINQPV